MLIPIEQIICIFKLTSCNSTAACSQLLNVKVLYKTTVAAYKPHTNKATGGRKRTNCFHSLIKCKLTFSEITAIHILKNRTANKSHSINFVICNLKYIHINSLIHSSFINEYDIIFIFIYYLKIKLYSIIEVKKN